MDFKNLTPLADYLITELDKNPAPNYDKKISVNPVVSEVASWYEKLRNAMDYREDDAILRTAIERILKRRFLLGGSSENVAIPLVRELAWARYFPDETIPESISSHVAKTIELYLKLEQKIHSKHRLNHTKVHEWIMQLMSSEIENSLSPSNEKELMTNFIFQMFKNQIVISDDTEETRDVQVFIAVRRTFAKQDLPLLRYHLFIQLFGRLTDHNLEKISDDFAKGVKQIEYQLNYPLKDRFYTYIKNRIIPYLILDDVFHANKGKNHDLVSSKDEFKLAILNSCSSKYKSISTKVRTAIIRGVIFILVTKAIFALSVEGTYESYFYGRVLWNSIALNTLVPPILMIIAGVFISTPNRENSLKVWERVNQILFESENKNDIYTLSKNLSKTDPFLYALFILLWLTALGLVLGAIVYILSWLNFNVISQGVFVFFLTIVSFISYRITQTANMYKISDQRQGIKSVLFDFFFMPFIHMGRQLTESIAKINLILFLFDLVIETPFKVIFGFFEEWFLYLRTQREKLG